VNNIISFDEFIANKPLYYKEIDYTRIYKAYDILEPFIKKPKIIHLIGTNGKGSTGRIIASLLHYQNIKIGHFSSPHIIEFNERIWINGENISNQELQKAHLKLYQILGKEVSEGLSYFEYTTLLSLVAIEKLDIIIFEAGLGGEFDATNIVKKELSVVTPIGFDHQDFLGNSIKEIATTKLNSIEKKAIIGIQPYKEVYSIAKEIAQKKGTKLYLLKECWNIEENKKIKSILETLGWSDYLYENTLLAINALKLLELPYELNHLKRIKLFGRFYPLRENVIIDVGHNLLATKAISKALNQKFGDKKIILIYNSLDDKDYIAILKKLKKHIKRVEIIQIDTKRALNINLLKNALKKLSIEFNLFKNINNDENYLVFGSFYVVEAFIKKELLQI
jgi:dihydrofolate synthase/folylpolyglutamate synthase